MRGKALGDNPGVRAELEDRRALGRLDAARRRPGATGANLLLLRTPITPPARPPPTFSPEPPLSPTHPIPVEVNPQLFARLIGSAMLVFVLVILGWFLHVHGGRARSAASK